MTKFQTSLLALALVAVGIGGYWVYVGIGDGEPEGKRDPLKCPTCGRRLTQPDAPCFYCQQKKIRQQAEEAVRPSSAKSEQPSKTSGGIVKVILVAGMLGVGFVVVYWPQIRSLLRLKDQEAVETLSFRCPHCRRKLRYNTSKAGMPGQCPRCKEYYTFPERGSEPAD